eukprot:scaffold44421_cov26-Tisochrysis_lutea.AAC.2
MSPEDQATIVLQLGELGDNAFIGMVDHNFYPAPWDTPLNQSLHFSGIETATGNAYEKTVRSIQKLSSMGKGTRLRITIDVPQRELKIEQLKEGSDEARYAVNLSLVGQRVCLAVCFGPGQSMATLQAVDGSKAQVLLGNKQVSDLWDPENVVKPPALGSARTAEEEAKQKVRENQARTAELLENRILTVWALNGCVGPIDGRDAKCDSLPCTDGAFDWWLPAIHSRFVRLAHAWLCAQGLLGGQRRRDIRLRLKPRAPRWRGVRIAPALVDLVFSCPCRGKSTLRAALQVEVARSFSASACGGRERKKCAVGHPHALPSGLS